MKNLTVSLIIMAILASSFSTISAQSWQQDKIKLLQQELTFAESDYERVEIRREIAELRSGLVDERNQRKFSRDQDFSTRLDYVRGVMVSNDERAAVGMAHMKVDKALYAFLQTDFMKEYKTLKLEAESLAATFKAQAAQMPPTDVAKVKRGYSKITEDFNRFIIEIKRDFLDRKKLKLIRTNKEMYANSLQYKLRDLKDGYSQDFERVVAEVTGSDMYAAVPIAAIFGLIQLAREFTEFIVRSNYEARRVKEEHLNQYLVEPYRFRNWFEIEMLEGDIYNQFDSSQDFETDMNGMEEDVEDSFENLEPFEYDVDAPSLSRKRKRN